MNFKKEKLITEHRSEVRPGSVTVNWYEINRYNI